MCLSKVASNGIVDDKVVKQPTVCSDDPEWGICVLHHKINELSDYLIKTLQYVNCRASEVKFL